MARQEIEHNRRRRDRRFQHQIVAIDLDADAGGALGTKIKPLNIKLTVISQLPRMRLATPNHVPLKTYFTAIQTAVLGTASPHDALATGAKAAQAIVDESSN